MLLQCKEVSKSFGADNLLENVTFTMEEKEKCAVVGVNGAGKTTLFRLIAGGLSADAGEISLRSEASVGYLEQMAGLCETNTVYEEMLTVFASVMETEDALRQCEEDMAAAEGEDLAVLMRRYERLTHDFERAEGYGYKSRIRGVIRGLGFADKESDQKIGTFSGGQKTRLAMAKLLLAAPDLLLLDEPTNHLDIEGVQWLEEFLRGYGGGVLLISHDRYFLDRVVTKIVEIDHGRATVYSGGYTHYASRRDADLRAAEKRYSDQQKEIKKQEETIRLLKSFNREKSVKRAESREKMLNKMERLEKPGAPNPAMRLALRPRLPSGEDVLFVENLAKSFDNKTLFENVSLTVRKGEKIALVGPNGVGKTTLLRVILGRQRAGAGSLRFGAHVRVGYYDQENQNIDDKKNIFQEISDSYPKLTAGDIRNALAAFVFTGDDVFKPISALSGGERGRVALAKIMLGEANFLILDEPTNHLDIVSKEILEEALRAYEGTALFISHDRYFINRTATKVAELGPDGVKEYLGGFDDMMEKKQMMREGLEEGAPVGTPAVSEAKEEWRRKKEEEAGKRRRQARLERTERDIEAVEGEIAGLEEELAAPELAADSGRLAEIYRRKVALEDRRDELYGALAGLEG